MCPTPRRSVELPPPLGATVRPDGVEFSVYAGHADGLEICLFDAEDSTGESERRVRLTDRAHGTWFGFVPGIGPGQRYAVRAHGPWRPAEGLRHNPDKLLVDPYARALDGQVTWRPEVFGHVVDEHLHGEPDVRDTRDSAAYVPKGVVVDDTFDWGDDAPPLVPWSRTVLYETHVRNLTRRHPGVPEHLRGTYAGMAHPATIEHLTDLGVTSVELLPVHAFTSEPALVQRGLVNHWGYNTLGFFAPHAAYAAAADPQGVLDEFKGMVKLLHAAGLEVILDVVYNHTCEQGRDGATLSLRGLDNRAYYRLDERGRDIDVTGCGNTVDLRHPMAVRLVLDSLRYWVQECHVDGFRFDLAVALGRGRDDAFDPDHPFLVALRTDPVLSRVKLVAEPWDVGIHGWRTGQFPPPFVEWNDRFRDTVRTFWLPDTARSEHGQPGHGVRELATRLAGSQDLFGARDRGPVASVNFVAAHDGFTLADTTAYAHKHNGANGEDNRDGHDDNRSWNHGAEGPTADPGILAARQRSVRNMLATTLLATGVPMLNAGDEIGRTQRGNNNAYCQDNDLSWFDWDLQPWQRDLLETTQFLVHLRASQPVLRQRSFFTGRPAHADGTADLEWYAADGVRMHHAVWEDPHVRTLTMFLDGSELESDSFLVVLHGDVAPAEVVLPGHSGVAAYELLWDSSWETPYPGSKVEPGPVEVASSSVQIYAVRA
ncbi:glycogen debranching protein GlgX [Oryzihumus sp.]